MKLLILVLFCWLTSSYIINMHRFFLPEFFGLFEALIVEITSGEFVANVLATFGRVSAGLFIGVGVGVPIGVLIGISSTVRRHVLPSVEVFRSIPTSMLFPLFIVSFGIGELSKLVIVASATFPIMIVSTFTGMVNRKEIEDRTDYLNVHKNLLPLRIVILARVWNAIPAVIGGLKIAISTSLVLTIVTEMFFIASSGVGWAAHQSYLVFDLDKMYAYILVVGLIGLAINKLFDRSVTKLSKFM